MSSLPCSFSRMSVPRAFRPRARQSSFQLHRAEMNALHRAEMNTLNRVEPCELHRAEMNALPWAQRLNDPRSPCPLSLTHTLSSTSALLSHFSSPRAPSSSLLLTPIYFAPQISLIVALIVALSPRILALVCIGRTYGGCACVEAVLDELLDGDGEVHHHLARADAVHRPSVDRPNHSFARAARSKSARFLRPSTTCPLTCPLNLPPYAHLPALSSLLLLNEIHIHISSCAWAMT